MIAVDIVRREDQPPGIQLERKVRISVGGIALFLSPSAAYRLAMKIHQALRSISKAEGRRP